MQMRKSTKQVLKIKVTEQEKKSINIERDDFHGEWNYCIMPNL